MKLHKRFLANVRRRRLDLGLTQAEVARRLAIAQPTYAAIEAGRRNPGLDVVERVAGALSCDPTELLEEISEKIPA